MPSDYYPAGPFIRRIARDDEFEVAREDFLLQFGERTARAYKSDLEDFWEWCVYEDIDPIHPSDSVLDRYLESVLVRGYAPGTMRRRAAAVRGFLGRLKLRQDI